MNELFVLILLLACGAYLFWGFRYLQRRGWQMLASLPVRFLGDGQWQGLNLTWYGLLTANAYLAALLMLLLLLAAAQVPVPGVILVALVMLGLCVPASRWVARLVEGKSHTFTVGGAVFVGIIAAPWVVLLVGRSSGLRLPVMTVLAAIAVAYAFGEGLGRLACISFGCCYGKPVKDCCPRLQGMFKRWHFVFHGETRKICYASGLEGEPVVPVQALTALLYVGAGLIATELFLHGCYASAFVLVLLVTQLWRVFSEFLRADYRGDHSFSPYQWMGLAAIPYALLCSWYFAAGSQAGAAPQLSHAFVQLWQPGVLLFLQLIWIVLFIYTGRSSVTGSNLSFHIHRERI